MDLVKRPLGFVLLFGGLFIIFYGLYSSYNIFTGKEAAPVIFGVVEQPSVAKAGSQDLQAQLQEMLGNQLKGMLPAELMPKFLNLFSWSIFAGILILGGGQISGLGIKLIK